MVKPKFNGGDIVRLANLDTRGMLAAIGATAEVTNPQVDTSVYFDIHEPTIAVRWLSNNGGQNDGDYPESMFELVSAADTATSGARLCSNDNVEVYDATGDTLAEGLRNAALVIEEWGDESHVSVDVSYIDGEDCVTIYRHV